MSKYNVLYNPKAGNGACALNVDKLKTIWADKELTFTDITKLSSYKNYFDTFSDGDSLVIAGGDGTLNRFVNETSDLELNFDIYYFAAGCGNDFLNDIGGEVNGEPTLINKYLVDLPEVEVKGKRYKFINGIGYGVDGYCCEIGDKLRETTTKPVNYAGIAIKGVLFNYKPTNARVYVNGKVYTYKKVWIAPTMNGRCYGGGMIPTPDQDRLNADRTVSTMIMYGSGRLKTLLVFKSIFTGEHVKHTEMVAVHKSSHVKVEFDKPVALQIDGETVTNVSSYEIFTKVGSKKKTEETANV